MKMQEAWVCPLFKVNLYFTKIIECSRIKCLPCSDESLANIIRMRCLNLSNFRYVAISLAINNLLLKSCADVKSEAMLQNVLDSHIAIIGGVNGVNDFNVFPVWREISVSFKALTSKIVLYVLMFHQFCCIYFGQLLQHPLCALSSCYLPANL